MTLEQASIFVNLKKLRFLIHDAQYLMDKASRVIVGNKLLDELGKALASFTLAFELPDDKVANIDECLAHFVVFKTDYEYCLARHIIKYKHRDSKEDSRKLEVLELIASIDDDIVKYRKSLKSR